jgi:hypothetical protein
MSTGGGGTYVGQQTTPPVRNLKPKALPDSGRRGESSGNRPPSSDAQPLRLV